MRTIRERISDSGLDLRRFIRDNSHGTFNLPIHGGVPLGNARSARYALGVAGSDWLLSRAHLAQLPIRDVPYPVVHRARDVAPGLAQATQGLRNFVRVGPHRSIARNQVANPLFVRAQGRKTSRQSS